MMEYDELPDGYISVLEYVNWLAQQPGMPDRYTVGDCMRQALEYHGLPAPPGEEDYQELLLAVMDVLTDPPYRAVEGPPPRRAVELDGVVLSPGPKGWQ